MVDVLTVFELMISADVKAFEVCVIGKDVCGLLLVFPLVVSSLVDTAVGFVKGVVFEETVEGV